MQDFYSIVKLILKLVKVFSFKKNDFMCMYVHAEHIIALAGQRKTLDYLELKL